jgi:dihydrofolate synthase/folylpolyglutamate synthase
MKNLQDWLAHCEQLHPQAIDMGLGRVQAVAERMALHFDCPVITVAGTNGKGSTCAMLEAILLESGYRTGVYTSPHLVHFEERCRIHGLSASADALAQAFEQVEAARGDVSLTYFEFSTLAILHLLAQAGIARTFQNIRLFANMMAGHLILKLFASFSAMLAGSSLAVLGIVPLLLNIGVTGLEFLVAVLQTYVFTLLTCLYINDAINLH